MTSVKLIIKALPTKIREQLTFIDRAVLKLLIPILLENIAEDKAAIKGPGNMQIAEETGLSISAVEASLKKLSRLGILHTKKDEAN